MGTQVVRHKSRKVGEKFQFTANGETSWIFIAEGDGEIYDDSEKTNVASYTINGVSETLPYTLVNGTSYTIAITKTTGGQTAELNLLTRRAVDKQNVYNVPDFGAYVGDFFFALKDNDVLVKFDRNLFASSNYAGSGVWTNNPIVASVTLPTLPSGNWNGCHFGNGKIICIANNDFNIFYICLVDYITLNIEDLDGNANQYTTFSGSSAPGVGSVAYNYISNQLLVGTTNQINILDLSNKTFIRRPSGSASFVLVGNNSPKKLPSFNPTNETYTLSGDLKEASFEGYAINYKYAGIRGVAYNNIDGYTYLNDTGNRMQGFDVNGIIQVTRTVSSRGFQNVKHIKNDLLVAWNYISNRYLIFSDSLGYTEIDYSTIDGYETNMFLDDIAIGDDIIMMKNNLTSLRLFIFDSATKTYTGYLDLTGGTDIKMICASQHI